MRQTTRQGRAGGAAVLAGLLVLVLVRPGLSFGDEAGRQRTAFKIGAGAAFYTGQDFDPGFLYSGGLFTLISSRLGLDFLVTGNRVRMNEPPAGLGAGKLSTTQLLMSGQYRFLKDGRFIPYGIFGVEFNFYHFWPADEAAEPDHDVVNRFAPHFGAGLEWALSNAVALNADAKYSIATTWVEELPREGRIGEVNPEDVDLISLDALTLTLSLKLYF